MSTPFVHRASVASEGCNEIMPTQLISAQLVDQHISDHCISGLMAQYKQQTVVGKGVHITTATFQQSRGVHSESSVSMELYSMELQAEPGNRRRHGQASINLC